MILVYIKISTARFSFFQSIFGKKKIIKFLLHNLSELKFGNQFLGFGYGTCQVLDVLYDKDIYNGVDISNAYTKKT